MTKQGNKKLRFFRDIDSSSNLLNDMEHHAAGVVIETYERCESGKELAVLYWHPFDCQLRHDWRSFDDVILYDIPDCMLNMVMKWYRVQEYTQ